MDDWNLDEKLLGKRQQLQHCESIIPQNLQRMTNDVGLTISVGDTIYTTVYNQYWARQLELVTLNIKFSVVINVAVEFEKQPVQIQDAPKFPKTLQPT